MGMIKNKSKKQVKRKSQKLETDIARSETINILITEGKRHLEMKYLVRWSMGNVWTIQPDLLEFDSSLPHRKSVNDWKFYGKAITKIMKELEKEIKRKRKC